MPIQHIAQKEGFLGGKGNELKVKQDSDKVIFEFALPIIDEPETQVSA